MSARAVARGTLVVLALMGGAVGSAAMATAAQDDPGADVAVVCDDVATCPEVMIGPPAVEVAGVQVSGDDAREPGETEPFIINDGFGD